MMRGNWMLRLLYAKRKDRQGAPPIQHSGREGHKAREASSDGSVIEREGSRRPRYLWPEKRKGGVLVRDGSSLTPTGMV